MIIKLAKHSLLNRKFSVILTVIAVAISVFVLLGVEHIRQQAKANFTSTIAGTDLIVGAPSGDINLLLYSVFHIGNATNNISWQSYQTIINSDKVKWSIPISLGDSHRGFRVIGTSTDFFKYYQYGDKRNLAFAQGASNNELFNVTLGSAVAKKLNYKIGTKLFLTHGIAANSFNKHNEHDFTVGGILKATGTPIDNSLIVSLAAIEAIHVNWKFGTKLATGKSIQTADLTAKNITAFMLGLNNKLATFSMQRYINNFADEPLLAILPGVALAQLWQMSASMEQILLLISFLVLVAALIGLSTMILSSLNSRARELAILRCIGANPIFIFILIELEVLLIVIMGIILALVALYLSLLFASDYLSAHYGLLIGTNFLSSSNFAMLAIIICCALLMGAIPAASAYRQSLQQGLRGTN